MDINQSKEPQAPLYAVYGTLRRGFGNNRLLNNQHCEYLGTMRTPPTFKMVSLGGFPGVIPNTGEQEVTVEIFRVNDNSVERRLDQLEGYPNFYQKTTIDTQWGKANMYILSDEEYGHLSRVESGDWKSYVQERNKF
jgi:gamma-glutamylcyclotransferase (GGCT)/AIG2-like uncharacterized protein YtfP